MLFLCSSKTLLGEKKVPGIIQLLFYIVKIEAQIIWDLPKVVQLITLTWPLDSISILLFPILGTNILVCVLLWFYKDFSLGGISFLLSQWKL